MRLYATDVLLKTGNPMGNITVLQQLRQAHGEPHKDDSGHSYWDIEREDVQRLLPDAFDSEV